ncbi:MAG: DUF5597 domain-containing protein, partial [Bacillota bacterium]|nr:DUF5597 domain-containing protein [Bacillota bacterium]
ADELLRLSINPSALQGSRNQAGLLLAKAYCIVGAMDPLIRRAHQTDRIQGFLQDHDKGCVLHFSRYTLNVTYACQGAVAETTESQEPLAGGFVIEDSPDCFYLVGVSCAFTFYSNRRKTVNILTLEEGSWNASGWQRGRILNGDERMVVRFGPMPKTLRVELYEY